MFSAALVEIGTVNCKQRGYVARDVEKSGQEPAGTPKRAAIIVMRLRQRLRAPVEIVVVSRW